MIIIHFVDFDYEIDEDIQDIYTKVADFLNSDKGFLMFESRGEVLVLPRKYLEEFPFIISEAVQKTIN